MFFVEVIKLTNIKMKTVYILLLNILLVYPVLAQNTDDNNPKQDSSSSIYDNNNSLPRPFVKKSLINDDNMHFSLQTGVNAMSFGKSSMVSTFVAPELSYRINPKLNITVGTIALNSNFNNMMYYNYNEGTSTAIPNANQMFIYLKGDYQLTDRIRLRGTTFREVSNSSNPTSNPFSFNQLGVDFKISDHVSMSADFIHSNGQPPMGLYGINNPVFRSASPFGGSFSNNGW